MKKLFAIVAILAIAFNMMAQDLVVSKKDGSSISIALADIDSLTFTQAPAGNTVTDIDGNIYPTVAIGTQVWMAENLKVTKYNDGSAIPNTTDNTEWNALTTGSYSWLDNDDFNKDVTGGIYNYFAVATGKLCPADFHAPTHAEFVTLNNFLASNQGLKLFSVAAGGTNESGFNGVLCPIRGDAGAFAYPNTGLWLWTITEKEDDVTKGYSPGIFPANVYADNNWFKVSGYAVRCLKD